MVPHPSSQRGYPTPGRVLSSAATVVAARLPAPVVVEFQGLGEQRVCEEKLAWPEWRDGAAVMKELLQPWFVLCPCQIHCLCVETQLPAGYARELEPCMSFLPFQLFWGFSLIV